MADNQAGIELILSSPNVKPQLEEIIDSWEEIIAQELKAQKVHEQYLKEANAQFKVMELQNKSLRDAAKELMGDIQKSTSEIKKQGNESEVQTTKQKSGIISVIKEYINERKELKNLEKQINDVSKELDYLDLRQRAIATSARSGNKGAIAEFAANEKKIQSLNGTLGDLNQRFDSQSAKVELSNKKFAGLTKTLNFLKVAAVAAMAAIVAGAGLAFAAIVSLGFANDRVKNLFAKNQETFAKAKQDLANALAPVAFTVGKLLAGLAKKLSDFLRDNHTAVFEWAARVSGRIAGIFAFIGQAIDNTKVGIKKLGAEVDLFVAHIKLGVALASGKVVNIAVETAGVAIARKNLKEINEEFRNTVSPNEAASEAFKKTYDEIIKLGEGFFDFTNLTKEQIEAIKKLREEYAKLTEEINKQIDALNTQEAGPIAGIILKAELAAVAIEKERDRYLELAKALHKNQEEVTEFTLKIERLVKAVRDGAQKNVTDLLNETLKKLQNQLADNAAAEGTTVEELKLERTLDALDQQKEATKEIAVQLKSTGDFYIQNKKLIDEILKNTLDALSQLESDALESFQNEKNKREFAKREKELRKEIDTLEKLNAEILQKVSDIGPNITDDAKQTFILEFDTNQEKLDAAFAHLEDLKAQAAGVIEIDVEVDSKEIDDLKDERRTIHFEVDLEEPKVSGFAKFFEDIEEFFVDLNESLEGLLGEDFVQRYGGAFEFMRDIAVSSLDAQIEAIDALVEKRRDSVEQLEEDIQLEAEFKAAGLANDYDLFKTDLETRRALLAKTEKEQAVLAEKREKAQRLTDSIAQASSLATAIANMFKGVTATGNPLGFAIAIGLSALMIASFARAKIQAGKVARAYKGSRRMSETFGQFAPGEGYDDTPGQDRGLSVVDKYGNLRGFIGGDEHMSKQSVSKRHRNALDYLNENENKFHNVDLLSYLKGLETIEKNPPSLTIMRIAEKNERLREKLVVVQSKSSGVSKADLKEAVREAMKEHAQTMINYHESRPDHVPNDWMGDYYQINSKSTKHIKTK